MKKLIRIAAIILAILLVLAPLVPLTTQAAESSAVSEVKAESESSREISWDPSFDDSDVPVEQAAPDYWIYVKLVLGVAIGGFVIYILVKPKKRWDE